MNFFLKMHYKNSRPPKKSNWKIHETDPGNTAQHLVHVRTSQTWYFYRFALKSGFLRKSVSEVEDVLSFNQTEKIKLISKNQVVKKNANWRKKSKWNHLFVKKFPWKCSAVWKFSFESGNRILFLKNLQKNLKRKVRSLWVWWFQLDFFGQFVFLHFLQHAFLVLSMVLRASIVEI